MKNPGEGLWFGSRMCTLGTMIYPIALAILSVVLLLGTSAWKSWSLRRQSKTISDDASLAKVPDTHALGQILGDARVMAGLTQADQHQLRRIHSHVELSSQKAAADGVQMWMAIVVTLAIGSAALYVVLSKQYEQDSLKWAFGALGTVIGYWLKR
jgi:hypothetical protein